MAVVATTRDFVTSYEAFQRKIFARCVAMAGSLARLILLSNPGGAVDILRPAAKCDLAYSRSFNSLYPAYIRGLAYLQMGDGRSAAAEFQKILDHPGIVGRSVTGARSHLELARARKMMGDVAAARKSYEVFLNLWKDADPDIPVYQQAKAEYAKLHKS